MRFGLVNSRRLVGVYQKQASTAMVDRVCLPYLLFVGLGSWTTTELHLPQLFGFLHFDPHVSSRQPTDTCQATQRKSTIQE